MPKPKSKPRGGHSAASSGGPLLLAEAKLAREGALRDGVSRPFSSPRRARPPGAYFHLEREAARRRAAIFDLQKDYVLELFK